MSKKFGQVILATAYLPPVAFFRILGNSDVVVLENCENYQKQSYRNRTYIYGSGGFLPLTVPILREKENRLISMVRIDNSKQWKKQHLRAITSAYSSAPFFEHYFDPVRLLIEEEHEYLSGMNLSLIELILSMIEINCRLELSTNYYPDFNGLDLREKIHPKKGDYKVGDEFWECDKNSKKNGQYHQVFAHKSGFISNLSILDLLFNEGPETLLRLKI